MVIDYFPQGVCARRMVVQVEDGIITDLQIEGGCNGNLKGIIQLVKGQPAREIAAKLEGIRCGLKPTSCPDQLALALKRAL